MKTGRDAFGGEPARAPKEAFGFEDEFGPADLRYDGFPENYDRATHAVWEYDAGRRGRAEWRRYPDRIEEALESMCCRIGSPRFMYRPGDPEADGRYVTQSCDNPYQIKLEQIPPGVATRYVMFSDMTEREIYTGASRSVRRNGERARPPVDEDSPFY